MPLQADSRPSNKASWADQADEEFGTTCGTRLFLEKSFDYPAEGVGKKPKSKKKQTGNKQSLLPENKCTQGNTGDGGVEASESSQNCKFEGNINKVIKDFRLSLDKTWAVNDGSSLNLSMQAPTQDPALKEGWEVAASRKSRRNDDPEQRQNNKTSPFSAGRIKVVGVSDEFGPRSNSGLTQTPPCGSGVNEFRPQGRMISDTPPEQMSTSEASRSRWEKLQEPFSKTRANEKWATENKGKATSCVQKSGIADSHILENEYSSIRNPTFQDNELHTDSIPTATNEGLANSLNKLESCLLQPVEDSWQRAATSNNGEFFSAGKEKSETKDGMTALSKLLPSEKPYEKPARHCHVMQQSTIEPAQRDIETSSLGVGPFMLDEYLSSVHSDSICSDGDLDRDSDNECFDSDDFDSEASDASHDTEKRNKWFRRFFESTDVLTLDQLNGHVRQLHCPACKGGVGAIAWYRGLQPLLVHAKTVRTNRVKLHRMFAKVLEEEVQISGAGPGATGQGMFGRWKGLKEDDKRTNPLIVWPPMVIIQNTKLELDEQGKWIGMGNKELLAMFKDYNVMKARHSYGPHGHRGMSLVIFSDSPTGYMDAQRLDKHFRDARRGRDNWDQPGKVLFFPGGDRVLYGYMATAKDMEIFNKHSAGKTKLKWSLRHLQEAVFEPMRRMDEENHQLNWLKMKVQKQKEHSKTLEKTVFLVAKKLKMKDKEISVIRQRALEQYEENQKEMDCLEQTYKDRTSQLASDWARREEELRRKEDDFKQEHIQRCQQLEQTCVNIPSNKELDEDKQQQQQQQQQAKVEEEIVWQSELVEMSLKDSENYESQKRELMRKHHIRKMDFMRKQYEQALNIDKELEKEKTELLEKYLKHRKDICSVKKVSKEKVLNNRVES